MAFTDRFLKVPIQTYNVKQAALTGVEEFYENFEKFLPLDLSSYYPSIADGDEGTQIHMKCGHSFWAKITVPEFERLLNEHFDAQR